MLVTVACAPSGAGAPTPTSAQPLPTATPAPTPPPAPIALPTPTPAPTSLETFHTNVTFETYETEETVSLELDQLPGVASVSVTQLDVTVQYDPARLSPDEILRTLRNNPEVRIKDDTSGQ